MATLIPGAGFVLLDSANAGLVPGAGVLAGAYAGGSPTTTASVDALILTEYAATVKVTEGVYGYLTAEHDLAIGFIGYYGELDAEYDLNAYVAQNKNLSANYDLNAYEERAGFVTGQHDIAAYVGTYGALSSEFDLLAYIGKYSYLTGEHDIAVYQGLSTVLQGHYDLLVYSESYGYLTGEQDIFVYQGTYSELNGQYDLNSYVAKESLLQAQYDLNAYVGTYSTLTGEYDIYRYIGVTSYLAGEQDLNAYNAYIGVVSGQYDLNAYVGAVSYLQAQYDLLANEAFYGWLVNLETKAVSRYEGFNFNSLDGEFGAMDDGIYQLTGSTNNGTAIDAFIQLGRMDFGTSNKKRVVDSYTAASSDGQLTLSLTAEGTTTNYTLIPSTSLNTVKTNLARGPMDRYWQAKLANVDGSDFEIDSIELNEQVLGRKV